MKSRVKSRVKSEAEARGVRGQGSGVRSQE